MCNGVNRHQVSHRVLMDCDGVTGIARLGCVFEEQAADVEVGQTEGEISAADLKQVRTCGNYGSESAETLRESFG